MSTKTKIPHRAKRRVFHPLYDWKRLAKLAQNKHASIHRFAKAAHEHCSGEISAQIIGKALYGIPQAQTPRVMGVICNALKVKLKDYTVE